MLEYREAVDDLRKIIVARVDGSFNRWKLVEKTAETRILALQKDYGILFDFRTLKDHLSVLEAHQMIKNKYDPIDPGLKKVPTAHLVSSDNEQIFAFTETSWMNRGVLTRMFRDEDKALEWLETMLQDRKATHPRT